VKAIKVDLILFKRQRIPQAVAAELVVEPYTLVELVALASVVLLLLVAVAERRVAVALVVVVVAAMEPQAAQVELDLRVAAVVVAE
jgi:hypothetical protein